MIRLNGIKKIYKGNGIDTVALDNINIKIKKNDFVAVMGKSGCGKTTLLNILGCIDNFDNGEYFFEGVSIKLLNGNELAHFRNKKIGFVFQAFNLINEMTVIENVEMPLGYAGVTARKRRETAYKLLESVGLSQKISNYPTQLSGGQQQRVAIARSLANNPEIILADEPTGNLDTRNSVEVMELLRTLNNNGTTIIMVTHDEKVADFAKRKITLNDGVIIKDTGVV